MGSYSPSSATNSPTAKVMDAKDRLWLLDVGRVISPEGSLVAASIGGPKIVAIDTSNNQVFRTITFPSDVVFPDTVSA